MNNNIKSVINTAVTATAKDLGKSITDTLLLIEVEKNDEVITRFTKYFEVGMTIILKDNNATQTA